MKKQVFPFTPQGRRLLLWPGKAGLFILLIMSRVPQAQQQFEDQIQSRLQSGSLDQLAPPPRAAIPQTEAEYAQPGGLQVITSGMPIPENVDQPFQWGKFIFRPHVTYRFLYGDGIQSEPGVQNKTIIQEFSPGILINLGPDWVLDYTPTLRFYSDPHFEDGVDQSVILRGGVSYENWDFGLSQSYTSTTSPTVQTGTQVAQENYVTALSGTRVLNDRTSVDLGVSQNFSLAAAFQSSREWSTMDWLNYKLMSHLDLGVGLGGGYDNLDSGPDQTFEQLQGRIRCRITDRLSIEANGGLEDRQFEGGQRGDLISPLYGASVQYQPFQYTSIALNVNHSVNQSFFIEEVTETTTLGVEFSQRLLGLLHLDLGGNYTTEKYLSSTSPISNRSDSYYSFDARLSWPLLKRGTMGVTYQFSHNSSTTAGLSYDSTQIGFDIGYSY